VRLRWREQADFTFDPKSAAVYAFDWVTWKWVRHTETFKLPESWPEWTDFWAGVIDILTQEKRTGQSLLPPDTVVFWKLGSRDGFASIGVVRVLKAKDPVGNNFPTGS